MGIYSIYLYRIAPWKQNLKKEKKKKKKKKGMGMIAEERRLGLLWETCTNFRVDVRSFP